MLCILLLFSICVLPCVISTTVRGYVNSQRLARDEERTALCHGTSDANVFVIVFQSRVVPNNRNGLRKTIFQTVKENGFSAAF